MTTTLEPRPESVPAPPAPTITPAATTPATIPLGEHPPKARLALNIGVVAFGADARRAALTPPMIEQVQRILELANAAAAATRDAVPGAFRDEPPLLRIVSPLGTGLERAVAHAALDRGFEVQCVLASDREVLARSVSAEATSELELLLSRATAVFELDGADDDSLAAREASEAATEVLLDQSDLLLVLGDAGAAASRGAWYALIQARERELATIELPSQPPHALTITVSDRVGSPARIELTELRTHLVSLLSPPAPEEAAKDTNGKGDKAAKQEPDPIRDYFAETVPHRSWLAWTWSFFVGIVADNRLRRPSIRFDAFTSSITEWDRAWQTTPELPAPVRHQLDRTLRTAYVWPDSMSIYYGGGYRGSFVIATILGMATVLLVLFAFAVGAGKNDDLSRIASVLFVLAILAVTRLANQRRWHERWLDYRLLAELLRQQRFLAPMGRVPKFARLPAHDAYDDPRGTWMAWQAHAVARDAGLVTAKVDQPYRDAYLSFLRDGLLSGIRPDTGQIGYHESASRRFGRLEKRAANIREGLMWAAITVAVIEVVDSRILSTWSLPIWFAALVAVFTALGGAVSSLSGQADAARVGKRSRAMRERLAHVRGSLDRPEAAGSAAALGEVADAAADAMVAELADYRMVFQGKPLKYPG